MTRMAEYREITRVSGLAVLNSAALIIRIKI